MTDDDIIAYCSSCYIRLEFTSCGCEDCPKCGHVIVDKEDWLDEAEYRERVAKVDAEAASWNELNKPKGKA